MKVEDGFLVPLDLLRIGLAMKHAIPPAVALGALDLKLSSRKCEEVGRNGLCLGVADSNVAACRFVKCFSAVGDSPPVRWHVKLERKACLQIRLVKAGKR